MTSFNAVIARSPAAGRPKQSVMDFLVSDVVATGKPYFVYIMTNWDNTVLYIGMTNNLIRRVFEHREGVQEGFTKKYRLKKLVYFELLQSPLAAIIREKQLKGGSRAKKIKLIESMNSDWRDLWDEIQP
jgi:putative endonuclease